MCCLSALWESLHCVPWLLISVLIKKRTQARTTFCIIIRSRSEWRHSGHISTFWRKTSFVHARERCDLWCLHSAVKGYSHRAPAESGSLEQWESNFSNSYCKTLCAVFYFDFGVQSSRQVLINWASRALYSMWAQRWPLCNGGYLSGVH